MEAPKRLLLVEPDPTFRSVVTAWLVERGWAVAAWADGRAALARFDDVRPDVVLAALEGEDLDGLYLIDAIARRTAPPPVVLCARHQAAARWDRASLDALGVGEVIVRPIAFPALAARLDAVVARARKVTSTAPAQARIRPLPILLSDANHVDFPLATAAAGGDPVHVTHDGKRRKRRRRHR